MRNSITVGSALAGVLLFPGDCACALFGLDRSDRTELVRMLINSLVWIVVGMLAVLAVV